MGEQTARISGLESRATSWVTCAGGPWYPELPHGGFAAYRIWQEFDGRSWFQRHEWRHADGSTHMEDWIAGVQHWCAEAAAMAEAA